MRSIDVDQSTRARIRDAALARFASDGLRASLRTIAGDAGVSAGLIVHHFGSRDGLLAACHDHTLEVVQDQKTQALVSGDPGTMFAQLAQLAEYAPVIGFTMRSLQAGGPTAARITADLQDRTETYLAAAVEAGTVNPSRDPKGRARLLTAMQVGVLMSVLHTEDHRLEITDLADRLREMTEAVLLAGLELYTQPLLTDASLLDALLAQQPAQPTPQENP